MLTRAKLKHEAKELVVATLYFGFWLVGLVILKQLMLAEYQVKFNGVARAVMGTLILAKVVLILGKIPLGPWVRARPAWVDVVVRTVLYAVGTFLAIVVERSFDGRREHGGFIAALQVLFREAKGHHVLANTICLTGALLGFNVLRVLRQRLGPGGLARAFLTPLPERPGAGRGGVSGVT